MPETFLILGASSFYGANFASLCRERGDKTIEFSRPFYDVNAEGSVMDVADYVVDFIAKGLVAESWDAPADWLQTNTVSKARLFDNLRQLKRMKKYIHVSTPEVYGNTPFRVFENCRMNPSTPYAVSKAATDMLLKAYFDAYRFPMVITRTSNIYGAGQQEYRLIPSAFRALREGTELKLHGGGNAVRDFIHVSDACAATYLLAKQGVTGETYHISTENERSVASVAAMIGCKVGSKPSRLGSDNSYLMSASKLRSMGWKPEIPFLTTEVKEGGLWKSI